MGEVIKKAFVKNWSFWICLGVSIALGVTGFFIPPKGVIDGSVLTYTGELIGFVAVDNIRRAISKGLDARVKHGKTEVTIGDLNNQNQ